ncbi:preQ(1) synthase [Phaeovibrio sulfidiphilus]|uniref:NADPH-dependent 7-cyano-7-deazaguanine reductase n=1 Tax=Phaeovibrio sulfidiphilus TaxID=1220600 RepID=A0A8J7CNX8_9PROT|nr:preQ(1) synthase [Phaeovibrio sulfidiphilus]MBE1236407.1 preQ(1) synthase [Phaeovibrio sulfidiphilus]
MRALSDREQDLSTSYEFRALGRRVDGPSRDLETFPAPAGVSTVTFSTDEFTSFCPVTNQPDFSSVTIEYVPDGLCLESKSLKLYLWSFRDEPAFCEALAARIAADVKAACRPKRVEVTVAQKPRGGLALVAVAREEG